MHLDPSCVAMFSFFFSVMNTILAELTRVCVLVFVDDVLIYSRV